MSGSTQRFRAEDRYASAEIGVKRFLVLSIKGLLLAWMQIFAEKWKLGEIK